MKVTQRVIISASPQESKRVYMATVENASAEDKKAVVDDGLADARPLVRCRDVDDCPCLEPFLAVEVGAGETISQVLTRYSNRDAYPAPEEVHPPAYPETSSCQEPARAPCPPACFPPLTDPYRAQQHYLDRADLGVDIGAAANLPCKPVRLVDIEQGWQPAHEDLRDSNIRDIEGENHKFHGHGTAVLGILAAQRNNGLGIRGILPDSLAIKPISQYWVDKKTKQLFYSTAEAICVALKMKEFVKEGDIIMLQAQHRDPATGYLVPVEADPAVYCAIKCAVECRGIIVIEAAGNGGLHIDNLKLNGRKRFRPDCPSGAILVAAATAEEQHRPMFFSNRGTYIDCFAWGEDVTTCGDGETSQEIDDYIPEFGGTSSATAIVAGVAAFAQAIARAKGKNLCPAEMRWLLTAGGTKAAPGSAPIGRMPNLAAIVKNIKNGVYYRPTPPPPPCDGELPDSPPISSPGEVPAVPPARQG